MAHAAGPSGVVAPPRRHMWILALPFAAVLALFLVAGYALTRSPQRGSSGIAGFCALLALSALPLLWHYAETVRLAGHALDYVNGNAGQYGSEDVQALDEALLRFRLGVPVGAAALWALACGAASRLPLLSALLPAVAFVLYKEGPLDALHRAVFEHGGGDAIMHLPDGKLLVWTFVLTAAAQLGIALYAALRTWQRA